MKKLLLCTIFLCSYSFATPKIFKNNGIISYKNIGYGATALSNTYFGHLTGELLQRGNFSAAFCIILMNEYLSWQIKNSMLNAQDLVDKTEDNSTKKKLSIASRIPFVASFFYGFMKKLYRY